jgi:XRE family transcriptional regulator, regulator of sulfur utilization
VRSILRIRKLLGDNIRASRKRAGFSQEKLAEKADLHPVYVGQVERGEKAVSVEALFKISAALGTSVSNLFRGI